MEVTLVGTRAPSDATARRSGQPGSSTAVTVLAANAPSAEARLLSEGVRTVAALSTMFLLCYDRRLLRLGVLWVIPAIVLAVLHRRRVAHTRISWLLCAFVVWMGLCSSLAGFPTGSFMLPLTVGAIVTGAVLAGFGLDAFGKGLTLAAGALVTVSVVVCTGGWWDIVREQDPLYAGAWKGVFNQKNTLAFTAALLIVLCIAQYRTLPVLLSRTFLAMGAIALVESRGMSALAGVAYPIAILALVAFLRRRNKTLRMRHAVVLTAALTVGVAAVLPQLLARVHRDPTLTGRTVIWDALWRDAKTVLMFGHGVGAYWFLPASQPALSAISQTLHFRPGQAHNGALEVILDAGIPALLLLVGVTCVAAKRSLELLQRGTSWPLLVLAFGAMVTITDRGLYSAPLLMVMTAIVSAPVIERHAPVSGAASTPE